MSLCTVFTRMQDLTLNLVSYRILYIILQQQLNKSLCQTILDKSPVLQTKIARLTLQVVWNSTNMKTELKMIISLNPCNTLMISQDISGSVQPNYSYYFYRNVDLWNWQHAIQIINIISTTHTWLWVTVVQ